MDYRPFYSRLPDRRYDDFKDFLESIGTKVEGKPAFRWRPGNDEEERVLSYADLRALARGLGSRFIAADFKRGNRIGLLSENRPEWCVSYLGIVAAGFVVVPIDISLDDAGVVNNLKKAGCKALCLSDKQLKRHEGLADPEKTSAIGLELILDFDGRDAVCRSDRLEDWWSAAATKPSVDLPARGEMGGGAEAVVFFTSGTTGFAKGIVLSHKAVLENVNAARMSLIVDDEDVFVALLPLHHTYATTCFLPFRGGGGLYRRNSGSYSPNRRDSRGQGVRSDFYHRSSPSSSIKFVRASRMR